MTSEANSLTPQPWECFQCDRAFMAEWGQLFCCPECKSRWDAEHPPKAPKKLDLDGAGRRAEASQDEEIKIMNTASRGERAALAGSTTSTTFFQQAHAQLALESTGRFAALERAAKPTVAGSEPFVRYPSGASWTGTRNLSNRR